MTILSDPPAIGRNHPTIRRVRSLRRDRDLRDRQGVFLAEGPRLAREALASGAGIELAICTQGLEPALERGLRGSGVPLLRTSPAVHRALQDARSPQPILLLVRRPATRLEELLGGADGPALLVVAHGVQDPGNLGTILRTAEAAGASGMLVCGPSADLYHPRTVRATAGSIFRLPALQLDTASVPAALAAAGLQRVGSAPAAGRDYEQVDLRRPTAILLGGEGAGLPEPLRDATDVVARIPMAPGVESLSVGAAAAVLLFEAARQRRALSRDG